MSIIVNTHFEFRQHNRVFMHSVIFTEPVITRNNNYVIMFVSDIRRVCGCQWLWKDSWNSDGRQKRTIAL